MILDKELCELLQNNLLLHKTRVNIFSRFVWLIKAPRFNFSVLAVVPISNSNIESNYWCTKRPLLRLSSMDVFKARLLML